MSHRTNWECGIIQHYKVIYVFIEEYNKTQNNQQFNELKQQSNANFSKQNNQGVTKLKSKDIW